jgi:hypothetical protein
MDLRLFVPLSALLSFSPYSSPLLFLNIRPTMAAEWDLSLKFFQKWRVFENKEVVEPEGDACWGIRRPGERPWQDRNKKLKLKLRKNSTPSLSFLGG